jgi:DNA-binding FadR family transcriptional regulator
MLKGSEYPPGSHLPSERELMNRLGVGRPAVREAMQALEAMGLARISHGERARVTVLEPQGVFSQIDTAARHLLATSPQTLDQLKEARLLFETGMVRIAANKATEEGIRKLEQKQAELRDSSGDMEKCMAADVAFHNAIAEMSGNSIYIAVSKAMLGWLKDFHMELLYGAHHPEGAVEAMIDHLRRAGKLGRFKPARARNCCDAPA